jgi:hypothetical protein
MIFEVKIMSCVFVVSVKIWKTYWPMPFSHISTLSPGKVLVEWISSLVQVSRIVQKGM